MQNRFITPSELEASLELYDRVSDDLRASGKPPYMNDDWPRVAATRRSTDLVRQAFINWQTANESADGTHTLYYHTTSDEAEEIKSGRGIVAPALRWLSTRGLRTLDERFESTVDTLDNFHTALAANDGSTREVEHMFLGDLSPELNQQRGRRLRTSVLASRTALRRAFDGDSILEVITELNAAGELRPFPDSWTPEGVISPIIPLTSHPDFRVPGRDHAFSVTMRDNTNPGVSPLNRLTEQGWSARYPDTQQPIPDSFFDSMWYAVGVLPASSDVKIEQIS